MNDTSKVIQGKATICIPSYKTLDLTRLALRSIRKLTNYPYEVIVVDNDSRDESLDYLRRVSWIKLIERSSDNGALKGSIAEGSALDIGLKACNSEFYVAMHSDTIVHRENWLTNLIKYFDNCRDIACVGTDRINLRPNCLRMLKKVTDFRACKRALFPSTDKHGRFRHHNQTICCLYRTDALKREKLSFMPDTEKRLTAGKPLYFSLKQSKYETIELEPEIMRKYVIHLDHATQTINTNEFHVTKHTIRKTKAHVKKVLSTSAIQSVIADASLDS